jgi:hypothetical protein
MDDENTKFLKALFEEQLQQRWCRTKLGIFGYVLELELMYLCKTVELGS